jgi:hypothetical protein
LAGVQSLEANGTAVAAAYAFAESLLAQAASLRQTQAGRAIALPETPVIPETQLSDMPAKAKTKLGKR